MNRRDQWIRFYEQALAGTADSRGDDETFNADRSAVWIAEHAERVATEAMARLDARDFPGPKVEALIKSAREVAFFAGLGEGPIPPVATDALGKALASFGEES